MFDYFFSLPLILKAANHLRWAYMDVRMRIRTSSRSFFWNALDKKACLTDDQDRYFCKFVAWKQTP